MEGMRRCCSHCQKEFSSQEALECHMDIDHPTGNEIKTLNLFGEGDVVKHKGPQHRSRKIFRLAQALGKHKRLHVEREREEIHPPPVPKNGSCLNVIQKTDVLNHSAANSTPVSSYSCPSEPSIRWIRTGERDWTIGSPYSIPGLSPTTLSLLFGQRNEDKSQVSELSSEPQKRQKIEASQVGKPRKFLSEKRGLMWKDGSLSSGNHREKAFLETEFCSETTSGRNNPNERSTALTHVDDNVRKKTKKVTKEKTEENGPSKRYNCNTSNTLTLAISRDRPNIHESASQEASSGQPSRSSGTRAVDFDINEPFMEE